MAYQFIYGFLLLLLIGQISTVPEPHPALRDTYVASCKDQNKLSDRLDSVEKRVEETVQKLEAELAVLLDAIEAPSWSAIMNTDHSGPAVDIFDESNASTLSPE